MVNVIRLRKGLDINLKGKAEQKKIGLKPTGLYALLPDGFVGIVPKVVVKEGEQVDAGQALFVDKKHPEIQFVSPVSGTVKAVVRGERRKVMSVQVEAAAEQQSVNHGKKDPKQMQGSQVLDHLLKAGLFGFLLSGELLFGQLGGVFFSTKLLLAGCTHLVSFPLVYCVQI